MKHPLADQVARLSGHARETLPPAVVLAGGLGTRLRSAYSAGPKSMAPVKGRPFLDYLLNWLKCEGVTDVILCVGYKRSYIRRFLGGGRKWGLRVKYSNEQKLLGTGGAIKKAERLIAGDRLLVVNGDTFLEVKLRELMRFHLSQKAGATLAAVRVVDDGRYGSVRVDGKGRITTFLEKRGIARYKGHRTQKGLINGGVYVFEKKLLKMIGRGANISLERELFPALLAKKCVYGFKTEGYFLDIGIPEDLRRAQSELPKRIRVSHSR